MAPSRFFQNTAQARRRHVTLTSSSPMTTMHRRYIDQTQAVSGQGRRSWRLGVLTPLKYAGGVRVCFDPSQMSHSFIHNCSWTTLQVSHHQGWKTCIKNGR